MNSKLLLAVPENLPGNMEIHILVPESVAKQVTVAVVCKPHAEEEE